MKRLTTEEFIKKAKSIHGSTYDYSKVQYVNAHTPITIICPIHGEFKQTPNEHLSKYGCNKCGHIRTTNAKRDTLESFIKKATKVHGSLYDYSKVQYKDSSTNIVIICRKHGDFEQKPNNHLNGQGCPNCKLSKGEVEIETFLKIHKLSYNKQVNLKVDPNIRRSGNIFIDFEVILDNKLFYIEYNGIQHYEYSPKFFHKGGIIEFEEQQKRDQYVRYYCENNNISLLEISYKESIYTKLLQFFEPYINAKLK